MPNEHRIIRYKYDTSCCALGVVPTVREHELRVYAVRTPVRRFISIVTHVKTNDGWEPRLSVHVAEESLPELIRLCQAAAAVLPDLPPPPAQASPRRTA